MNFVKRVSYLAPGDGYRKCVPLKLLGDIRDTVGIDLTAATVPALLALETNFYGLNVAAGQTHVGLINWAVPEDYDDSADELRVRLLCNRSADTAADLLLAITPFVYRKRFNPGLVGTGVVLSADLGCPTVVGTPGLTSLAADAVVSTAQANTKWIEFNMDFRLASPTAAQIAAGTRNRSLAATADASIRAGDALTIRLTTAALTDSLYIYGAQIWYRSNLAFTNIDAR